MTTRNPRMARVAVATIFALHGLIIGSWVPNIVAARLRLDVGLGVFGQALLCAAAGAILAMPVTGALVGRFGSARLTLIAGIVFCCAFLGPVFAPELVSFCLTLGVFGAAMGSMDVAMNAHGIAVEKRLGLPVMSAFHGMFSLGAALGVLLGVLLIGPLGLAGFSCLMAMGCLGALLIAARGLLASTVDQGSTAGHFGWPTQKSLWLGLLCFLVLMSEGAVIDWAAIELQMKFAVSEAVSGLGFGLFASGMMGSRFLGDALRLRIGAVRLVRGSAILMALGLSIALAAPFPALALGGYLLAGFGIGNIAPVLFAGGGRIDPQSPGRGLAAVTTLGYSGFLIGPPLIGMLAELTSLGKALGLLVVAGLIIALSAGAARAADT